MKLIWQLGTLGATWPIYYLVVWERLDNLGYPENLFTKIWWVGMGLTLVWAVGSQALGCKLYDAWKGER